MLVFTAMVVLEDSILALSIIFKFQNFPSSNVEPDCQAISTVLHALAFDTVSNLEISGVRVHNSSGYGLCLYNVYGASLISESNFSFNGRHALVSYDLNESKCSSLNDHPLLHLAIVSSTFAHGDVSGITIHIQHTCIDMHVNISHVLFYANGRASMNELIPRGNMAILVNETEGSTAFLHFSIDNVQTEFGKATTGGGLFAHFYRDAIPALCSELFKTKFFANLKYCD